MLQIRVVTSCKTYYIRSTSNDIHTDGARAKTGGTKGIRGDRRFKGRGGWRQVITLYTRILRTFAGSAYLVSLS